MELEIVRNKAIELMNSHGLRNWGFKFDLAKRRFGCCDYRNRTITLSKHLVLLNSPERVINTILHEIAHALTPGHHHDDVWRRKAIEIGYTGERCYSSKNTVVVEGKYVAHCSSCNHKHYRFRNPKYSVSCGNCSGGTYNENYKLVFVQNKEMSGNLLGLTV